MDYDILLIMILCALVIYFVIISCVEAKQNHKEYVRKKREADLPPTWPGTGTLRQYYFLHDKGWTLVFADKISLAIDTYLLYYPAEAECYKIKYGKRWLTSDTYISGNGGEYETNRILVANSTDQINEFKKLGA